MNKRFLTVDEVAHLLGLSAATIRRQCISGEIRAVKGEGAKSHWRIDRAAFESKYGSIDDDRQSVDALEKNAGDNNSVGTKKPPLDPAYVATVVVKVLEQMQQ